MKRYRPSGAPRAVAVGFALKLASDMKHQGQKAAGRRLAASGARFGKRADLKLRRFD